MQVNVSDKGCWQVFRLGMTIFLFGLIVAYPIDYSPDIVGQTWILSMVGIWVLFSYIGVLSYVPWIQMWL